MMEEQSMYGPDNTDLLVKYYDAAFGISGEAEVRWYLDKARTFGGPVLDLACGTGRLAILLARDGLDVTAVDRSPGMLNQFRTKLLAEPPEIQKRIQIYPQEICEFSVGRKFNTIVCCDAYFHNLTVEDQMKCLGCVSEHLAPAGRFVFNLPNPTCDFILQTARSVGADFTERSRHSLGADTLVVEQANSGNILDQTITTTLRITRYDAQGRSVETGHSTWTTRYLFRYEAVHLLYRCGFEVESLVGDYMNGPVTEKGQLVFQVRRKDPRAL
jgi:2-polyprenyl-3-methyl-5-hydroxy-6-metoxy-1,4-benzoquinol methylase